MANTNKPRPDLFSWLFRDKNGKTVVFQAPNAPIVVAGLAWAALLFVRSGPWHTVLEIIFNAGLIIWAVMELGWGTVRARRILGLVVLVWIFVSLVLASLRSL
ncbi:hypothetical protein HYX70_00915 [Candidatus Saccharibacteria bacterium]|nr:hypothetical protein [Candidatus Saccharibacteria bacterium]